MYREDEDENYFFYNLGWKKDTEEFQRRTNNMEQCRYYCSCGHSTIIPYFIDEKICSWCHRLIKKDAKRFFRDKVRQELNKKRKEEKYSENNNGGKSS